MIKTGEIVIVQFDDVKSPGLLVTPAIPVQEQPRSYLLRCKVLNVKDMETQGTYLVESIEEDVIGLVSIGTCVENFASSDTCYQDECGGYFHSPEAILFGSDLRYISGNVNPNVITDCQTFTREEAIAAFYKDMQIFEDFVKTHATV